MADETTTELDRADAALKEIEPLLQDGDADAAVEHLVALHPADQAEVIAELEPEALELVLPRLPADAIAEVLGFLKEEPRRDVVARISPAVLGPILDLVERDDAVDILHDMPVERAQETLGAMTTAHEVAPLLLHADETAGGRMTSDFVALNRQWTVEDALTYLRRTKPEAEQAFYLYVVDDEQRLEGVVSLRHLVVGEPDERIADLMAPDVMSVTTTDDQEEVAREIQRYNFVALPVVDEHHRLVGVVSVDDLMDVVAEEATEDMYRMAGLVEDESLLRPVTRSVAPRLSWLLLAFLSALAGAAVVNAFEDTIARVAVLAVFMPVVASLGGNTGVQTITLMVRSLALGEVELGDVAHILRREMLIAAINGIVLGLLFGTLAYAWQGNTTLGIVAGVAMLANVATAAVVGVVVPLTLRAARLDPALASGAVVTTMTDMLGFFFFLGLATLMVDRLA